MHSKFSNLFFYKFTSFYIRKLSQNFHFLSIPSKSNQLNQWLFQPRLFTRPTFDKSQRDLSRGTSKKNESPRASSQRFSHAPTGSHPLRCEKVAPPALIPPVGLTSKAPHLAGEKFQIHLLKIPPDEANLTNCATCRELANFCDSVLFFLCCPRLCRRGP